MPPHITHRTVQFDAYHGEVLCPLCNGENLHQMKATTYGEHVMIPFWCEHCGPKCTYNDEKMPVAVLHIVQNKGSTYMAWEPVNNSALKWNINILGDNGTHGNKP